MNIKTFGIVGALVALAVVIGLVGTNSLYAETHPKGSIFITGHDPDYHALSPSCSGEGAQHLLEVAITYGRNGSDKPLLVVYTNNPTDPGGHRDSIAGLEKVTTNYVRMNASKFSKAKLTPDRYSAIFVPSDFGGQLTQEELNALNDRKEDIRNYLNQGGGLIALAESDGGGGLTPEGGHYGFLPVPITSIPEGHKNGDVLTLFGAEELGLFPEDVTCNFSHNYFETAEGMDVVDYLDVDENLSFNDEVDQIMSLAYRGYYGPEGIVTIPPIIDEEDGGKVSICHATGNDNNPWELINVPANAVAQHIPGHEDVYPDEEGYCPARP